MEMNDKQMGTMAQDDAWMVGQCVTYFDILQNTFVPCRIHAALTFN